MAVCVMAIGQGGLLIAEPIVATLISGAGEQTMGI